VSTRPNKKIRLAILVTTGAALTGLLAGELLPSGGKPPPALEEWVEIGVATDGTKAFVNRRSIAETGTRIALRQRFTLGSPKSSRESTQAIEQRVIYDCQGRAVATLESRELNGAGAVLRTRKFEPPVHDAIRAASLPEYIYDAVC
jgi:hypothetical protein